MNQNRTPLVLHNPIVVASQPTPHSALILHAVLPKPTVVAACTTHTHVGLKVDNFPGFPEGVTGPDLMNNMRDQATRWGAVFKTEDVEEVDFSTRPFVVRSPFRTVKAQTVIIATGAVWNDCHISMFLRSVL